MSLPDTTLCVLQVTDTHLLARPGARLLGVDTADTLCAVLDQALSERQPDALLATGDIAHEASEATYAAFERIVEQRFQGPRLVVPGNHDLWAPMRSLLREPSVLELPGWRLIGLDSHVDDEPGAVVGDPEWQRLQEICTASQGEHVLVATHHPPIEINCPWLDKDRIKNGPQLLESLAEHGHVAAMVFGHAHQVVESKFREISLLGTPSTCFQFEPRSARFSIDDRKPGYRWLYLDGDGGVRSEVRRVDDYPLTIDLSQKH